MLRILTAVLLTTLIARAEQAAFLNPPAYIAPPDSQHAVTNRGVTMVSSMAVTPGGRLWAVWYAGVTPGEDQNNYVVLATSGDDGKTWRETLAIDPDGSGPVRAFDPEIWMTPDGTLYVFWAQTVGHDGTVAGVWTLKITNPEDAKPAYEAPKRLTDGVMMCKPIVLSSGEWVLPVSTWRKTDHSARMVVSSNQGKTWNVRGACNVPENVRSFDEHMIVERKNGSLWLLARTNYGIGESVSTDRGKTWPVLTPSSIPHTSSRFFITRLQSGNLLLVKHGPMNQKTGRSHLMAFISKNDGKTWSGGLLLDERSGISYPDGQQVADGTIYITYDYGRTAERNILFTSFQEEDAAAGRNVSDRVRLPQIISDARGGQTKKPTVSEPPEVKNNRDGVALIKIPAGAFSSDDAESAALSAGKRLFTDRRYTVAEALPDAHFLRVPLDGTKKSVCSKSGMLYFLTPQPERNHDSQARQLETQGFKKVALPEVRLFDPANRGNFCSLYQKKCTENEVIQIGKWALPVFFPEQP
ncbi:MAG: sialidase family protein [Kiritimatiellales bacterium]